MSANNIDHQKALFGVGGQTISSYNNTVIESIDKEFVVTRLDALLTGRNNITPVSSKTTVLYPGGAHINPVDTVESYHMDGSKTILDPLSIARENMAGDSNSNYTVLIGGYNGSYPRNTCDIYDNKLTKCDDITLPAGTYAGNSIYNEGYIIHNTGINGNGIYSGDVYTIDEELTVQYLNTNGIHFDSRVCSCNGNAFIISGYCDNYRSTLTAAVEKYDVNLTHDCFYLPYGRVLFGCTSLENYMMIGGGNYDIPSTNEVTIYQINI